jgi:hypothetical protein
MKSSPQYTEIRCSSTPSLYRYEELEGKRHIVVPVVMLVGDTVIQAANAPTPELVPLDCLERSHIKGFDSCPVTPYHPKKKGKFVSASSPEQFNKARIGTIFNTHLNSPNLGCEAWIDIERANEVGGDGLLALEKIEAGETIDISVGVYHDAIIINGKTSNGEEYGSIWTEIYGDHLALLPASEGACNQELGCGAPRVAESAPIIEEISLMDSNKPKMTFLSRLLSKLRPSMIFDDGDSDGDLRKMLTKEMRAIDPAFDWILDGCIYREVSSFIYMTYVIMGGSYTSEVKFWRRTYSLSTDGKSVTINNDAVEVKSKEVWETVEEGEEDERMTPAVEVMESKVNCSCENKQSNKETIAMEKEKEENKTTTPPAVVEQAPQVPVVAAAPTPAPALTVQRAIAACPDLAPLVAMGQRFQALEDARKADLVTRLSTAQKVYTLEALQTKTVDQLEEIAALLSIDTPKVDYSARGLQEPRSASAPVVKELPDPWGLAAKGIQLN